MLLFGEKLKTTPIMSLQTGAEIARATEPVIDPAVLDIIAYHVSGPRVEHDHMVLMTKDIREVSDIGFIVDAADELVMSDDVVKLKKIVSLGFQLVGLEAIDDRKKKLGKIYDYTLDPLTFTIHQLYVRRPLLKSLQTSDLIIGRTQILEVNNTSVIVRSATLEDKPAAMSLAKGFVNPFRSAQTPTDTADTD